LTLRPHAVDSAQVEDYSLPGIVTFHLRKTMPDYGKRIRLKRVLRQQRGTLVVAFDHGLVLGPIPGTLDPARKIERFVKAAADAILLNLGSMKYYADAAPSEHIPGLIARLDWTTAFSDSAQTMPKGFQTCLVADPEEALRAGADAVITFLFMGSGDPVFEKKEIQRVGKLARESERIGIPLIVESLARGPQVDNPRDSKWLMLHTRVAAELGADVVKTENAENVDTMRAVVSACPIPILVLGGSRTGSDEEVLASVRAIMQAGAAGVFFGRNVFQADDMPKLLERVRSELAQHYPKETTR
jgi:class I fructose-bisphosphate aldolase